MRIKSAGEIVINEARQAINAVNGCVTPIFDVNEKLEAELLGSAVLIEVADEIFLCTAKHVIDKKNKSTLYIDGASKFEILEGNFHSSAEHDVAVLRLTSAQIEALNRYVPLGADNIANQEQASACKYVEFLSVSRRRKTGKHISVMRLRGSFSRMAVRL